MHISIFTLETKVKPFGNLDFVAFLKFWVSLCKKSADGSLAGVAGKYMLNGTSLMETELWETKFLENCLTNYKHMCGKIGDADERMNFLGQSLCDVLINDDAHFCAFESKVTLTLVDLWEIIFYADDVKRLHTGYVVCLFLRCVFSQPLFVIFFADWTLKETIEFPRRRKK